MKSFTYRIKRDCAMHFGPAGRLAALTKLYGDCDAIIEMGNRCENITKPMKVATMGIRKGDDVVVKVDGPSEDDLLDVLYQYFEDEM